MRQMRAFRYFWPASTPPATCAKFSLAGGAAPALEGWFEPEAMCSGAGCS